MNKYITSFTTTEEFNASKSSLKKPHVSLTKDDMKVHYMPYDYSDRYLTFIALEDGTISFSIASYIGTNYVTSISYSTDNGDTWTSIVNTDEKETDLVTTINVSENDTILWKGIATQLCDEYPSCSFYSSCRFSVYGNIMSLLYGDSFKGQVTLPNGNYTFASLFHNYTGDKTCYLVDASNLVLPATTLATSCYNNMFRGCTNLTAAPELPVTTLANYCYGGMFHGCTSLTTAPELPATSLAQGCYSYMFYGCTSLTTAPELPATGLTGYCYRYMFDGCTSLTTAPELPATTLATGCYESMFYGCTSLNYIKAMFTTTPGANYTTNWVSGVAASGTFVKNSAAEWDVTGVSGVPEGWTVETASS